MVQSYGQREEAYRKRLLIIFPVAVFLVSLLFLTSDVVPYEDLQRNFGWEGATQLVPELTIIPDETELEIVRETAMKTLAALSVDVIDEKADAEGGEKQEQPIEKPDPENQPELNEFEVRNYESHTDVPYSEEFVILHMVQPEYPPRELIHGIEGSVTVEILVNDKGHVEDAWVLAAYGPKTFEEASLAAVRQFIFRPPHREGRPIPMWIRFDIRFHF